MHLSQAVSSDSMEYFNQNELLRYARHFSIPTIGFEGQKKLKNYSVICIGAGGIGCSALTYLAAAGIGKIGIIDFDKVELSNLQRQILYCDEDSGKNKAQIAAERLNSLNYNIKIECLTDKLKANNAFDILSQYDLVIDGSDNYAARYLINDVCFWLNKPFISTSVYRFTGQLAFFNFPNNPCYRCLYASPPPIGVISNCSDAGVFGVAPGIMGCFAANEVLKHVLEIGNTLENVLVVFDSLSLSLKKLPIVQNSECVLCAKKTPFNELPHYDEELCDSNIKKINFMSVDELATLQSKDNILIVDVRQEWEREICHIPHSIHVSLNDLQKQGTLELIKNSQKFVIVLYCKAGSRSEQAVSFLQEQGINNTYSLRGGILEWAKKIDQTLAVY